MNNKVLLVTGTSGTGKTTVLQELTKRGIETIGIDEEPHLTYWVDKDSQEPFVGDTKFDKAFLAQHEWICDIALLKKLIAKKARPLVICGSCDNLLECMKLCDQTLILTCPPEVFLARIEARTDNDYGKSEAAKAALLGYYEEYRDECLAAGAREIDAAQSIDEVVNEVMSYIQ